MARRVAGLLLLIVILVGLIPPAPVAAAPQPQEEQSPCYVAALAAISRRGYPYVWGAKGPTSFDCSGLTYWAWQQAGRNIGVSTYDQATRGRAINCRLSDLAGASTTCWEIGDLAFLRYGGGQHVAIYVGNGRFADAYHPSVGVIIHNPAGDSFYQANWWQARRILDCDDDTDVPAVAYDDATDGVPGLEEIPDVLSPVSFAVLQCGDCDESGQPVLPPQPWTGQWPQSAMEWLDLGRVYQTAMSWLAWQISEIARQILCWLLAMLAMLSRLLMLIANVLIYGMNSMLKLLILLWLSLKAYFLAFWDLIEWIRLFLWQMGQWLEFITILGEIAIEVVILIASLLWRVLLLIGQLAMIVIGIVGWLGGLFLGFWLALMAAMSGTTVPVQLSQTHIIYRAVRGLGEGVVGSALAWILYGIWAMAYVSFVTWLARFLSVGAAGAAGGGGSRDI